MTTRRRVMKRNALTKFAMIAVATFVASMVPTAQARPCSNAAEAGEYGLAATGSFILPTGPVPVVGVGRITEDADGNVVGSLTRSIGGQVSYEVLKGTVSINSDCTGTLVVQGFDASSGALVGTETLSTVVVDDGRKQLGISTKLIAPDGTFLPSAISTLAEKISAKD